MPRLIHTGLCDMAGPALSLRVNPSGRSALSMSSDDPEIMSGEHRPSMMRVQGCYATVSPCTCLFLQSITFEEAHRTRITQSRYVDTYRRTYRV